MLKVLGIPKRIIVYFVRKRIILSFSTFCFATGFVSLTAREWLQEVFVLAVCRLDEELCPSSPSTDESILFYVLSVLLMVIPIIVVTATYRLERKPVFRGFSGDISFQKKEDSLNEKQELTYDFYICFTMHVGVERIELIGAKAVRFVEGCECLGITHQLKIRGETVEKDKNGDETDNDSEEEDWKHYDFPVPIEALKTIEVMYSHFGGPPTPTNIWHKDKIEKGEIKFTIEFRIGNDRRSQAKTFMFRQLYGNLYPITNITSPPQLNDVQLKSALRKGYIDKSDYDFVVRYDERRRYLLLVENSQDLDSDFRTVQPLVRKIHQKIVDNV